MTPVLDIPPRILTSLQVLPSLPSSSEISDTMEGVDIKSPLMEKRTPLPKSTWSPDAAELFVLLCSFLLTTTSIVLVALVFHTQTVANFWHPVPRKTLSSLQRVISALSVTITSAVIMIAGKRYVFFKLTRGGLRSRRVAVYSNPTIGNLASYLISRGVEFPLVFLSAVWGLALATSLTVNDSWEEGAITRLMDIPVPFGPFDAATPGSSWIIPAAEQLNFAMSSLCLGVPGTVGLINITNSDVATDHSMGVVYYPPLPYSSPNTGFSFSTTLNGFNISVEPLSSVPSAAQNLSCAPSVIDTPLMLWPDGSDSQTLSIIATSPYDPSSIFRFNATAIIMGGTLFSTGDYTEFALNGTSWPNVMPNNSQWAQDITTLICNTTFPPIGDCAGSSFSDFASLINTDFESIDADDPYSHWSTVLNMAIGAYSSAMYPHIGERTLVPITSYGINFTAQYGIYILILHIVVSFVVLIVVVKLRMASHLGADFINSTRLLLDPLKEPGLFNASLETTVDTLEDPYMLVREDAFVLRVAEQESTRERRKWGSTFSLRKSF